MQLLPLGGTTRLPPLAALGWIIAYYVEFGKIRGTDCHVATLLAMTGGRGMRALSAPCGGTSPEGGGKGRWGPRAWSWLPLWGSWQRS